MADGNSRATSSSSKRVVCQTRTGRETNGFQELQEIESIRVSKGSVSLWSVPQEALRHEPTSTQVFQQLKGRGPERRIHANSELTAEEQRQLQLLRSEANRRDLAFLPSVSVQATRWLGHACGDHVKAVEGMQRTNNWRLEYFGKGPIKDTQVAEDLQKGVLYFCGRDCLLRPALVFRAARMPPAWLKDKDFTRLVRVLVFCMEYFRQFMAVPGKTENLNLIVDVKGLSFAKSLLGALQVIGRAMAKYYIGCMFKIRVVNMSTSLRILGNMAKSVLTERTKRKLSFADGVSELQQDFALHQLEEDLGGTAPIHKEFLPFPLQPGPFEAGYTGGPNKDAVPGLHAAISTEGMRGRLWDPQASHDQNAHLLYTQVAPELLRRCGMQPPDEADIREQPALADALSEVASSLGDASQGCPSEIHSPSKVSEEHILPVLAALGAENSDEENEVHTQVASHMSRKVLDETVEDGTAPKAAQCRLFGLCGVVCCS